MTELNNAKAQADAFLSSEQAASDADGATPPSS